MVGDKTSIKIYTEEDLEDGEILLDLPNCDDEYFKEVRIYVYNNHVFIVNGLEDAKQVNKII